jgi:O-antigen/teichoic acid export membrane protein
VRFNLRSPIVRNIGANLFGVVINLFNQILLVPFYLIYWGKDLYSDWIVISAISSFLLISDLGLNTVISNQFSIEYSKGNLIRCEKLLVSSYFFVILIGVIVLFLSFLTTNIFDLTEVLGLYVVDRFSANIILILLIFLVFLNMFNNSINSIYRALSLTSRGVICDNVTRITEFCILFLGILLKWDLKMIVFVYVIPKIFLLIFKFVDTNRLFSYRFYFSNIDFGILRNFIKPSISFMAFPIGNAIIIQGYVLLVNRYFSASELVLFTTTRTMVNFIKTTMGTISTAVWPEFTVSYGKADFTRVRKIHRLSVLVSFILTLLISCFLLIFGENIFDIWTNGLVDFDYYLMGSFILLLIANNFWYTSSVTMMATNNHFKLGIYYFISAVLAIFIGSMLIEFKSLPIMILSLLIMDFVLSFYTIKASLRITQDSFSKIIKDVKFFISKFA